MSTVKYVFDTFLEKSVSLTAEPNCWNYSIQSQFPVEYCDITDGKVNLRVGPPHQGFSIFTHLVNKKMNGKSVIVNEYNIRRAVLHFVDDVATGECKLYDEKGLLYFTGNLEKGYREGKGKEYYPNGKVLFKGYYHQGYRQGKGIEYSENGEGKEGFYENGVKSMKRVPFTELENYWIETDLENSSRVLCQIDDLGKRFGICYFYLSDKIHRVSSWNNGIEKEVLKTFSNNKMTEYSKGKKKYEGEYKDSLLSNYCRNGEGMEFQSDGITVLYVGGYMNGKRNGKGIAYRNHTPVYNGFWINNHRLWVVVLMKEFYVILFFGATALLFLYFKFPFEFWFIIPILFYWRRMSVVRCGMDLFLANCSTLKRKFVVGNGCCNIRHSLKIELYLLRHIEIGSNCFKSVKVFKIIGLNQLKSLKIGKNSFTQVKSTDRWDSKKANNQSKSFHILNCESLESIEIGEYSFCDFGGQFELKNLPALQSIQIGRIGSYSRNFFWSSFVIGGILNDIEYVMIRSS